MVSQIPREVVNLFLGNLKEEMAGQGAALPGKPEPGASAAQLTVEQGIRCAKMHETLSYPIV